jgi:membrane associated rhomboid family serine protease
LLIPLRDYNPRHSFPVVTLVLVVVNALVFFWQSTLDERAVRELVLSAGAIPREITTFRDIGPAALVPLPLTVFTAMFLHGGLMHLAGNMWFLWLFGDNVEDSLGRVRFVIFYFVTGAVGALAQVALMPSSPVPMIGASGAVAGILGGYILTFPHARIMSVIPIPFLWHVTPVPAWVFLGVWFLGQFFIGRDSGVAWMAHVGGFLGGLGLVRLFTPSRGPEAVQPEYFQPRRWRD